MRSIKLTLLLLLLVGVLMQACAPQAAPAGMDPALESAMRTEIVAAITMTAAQDAISAAQSTADSAVQTLAAPTFTPISPTTTLPPSQPPQITAIVSVSRMQMREGPDVHFAPLFDLYAGTTVFLLAKYGEWVYIQMQSGLKGWAYYAWLQFPSGISLADLPDAITIPNLVIPRKYP